jgi:hypothetical protein
MGVYIKGMEMPKSPILFCIHPDGKVYADIEGGWKEYKAVPVPPHGALMDMDEFFAACPELVDGYKQIADDLVVIEAEEGE